MRQLGDPLSDTIYLLGGYSTLGRGQAGSAQMGTFPQLHSQDKPPGTGRFVGQDLIFSLRDVE